MSEKAVPSMLFVGSGLNSVEVANGRPAMPRLLSFLLALLMLHWSAVSLLPRDAGDVSGWGVGVRAAGLVQPAILGMTDRSAAAEPRTMAKAGPPSPGEDTVATAPQDGSFRPLGHPPFNWNGAGQRSFPLRAFDARAPPAVALG